MTGASGDRPSATPAALGPAEPVWRIAATVLFLRSLVEAGGTGHPTVRRHAALDPAVTALATDPDFPRAAPRPGSSPRSGNGSGTRRRARPARAVSLREQ